MNRATWKTSATTVTVQVADGAKDLVEMEAKEGSIITLLIITLAGIEKSLVIRVINVLSCRLRVVAKARERMAGDLLCPRGFFKPVETILMS